MRLIDYIHQGGTIMWILLILNIVGISILFWRIFVIIGAKNNLTGMGLEIIEAFKKMGRSNQDAISVTMLKDEISIRIHRLEFGMNTIKIIAQIAPLLGLLGTVIGILSAFEVIAAKGLSNPSLFAGGISMALITTVGGLIVAIPHFIGYNYLAGILDDLEVSLERNVIPQVFGEKQV